MGAPNVDDWLPGNHSIIKTSDFKSATELGNYLNYLIENPEEYYKYFNWKNQGLSDKFKEKYNQCVFYNSECRLCEYLAKTQIDDEMLLINKYKERDAYALKLSGDGDFVEVPHNPMISLTNTWSIVAQIKFNGMKDYRIIDKNTGGKVDGYEFDVLKEWKHGYLRLCAVGVPNGCIVGEKILHIDTWYTVAATFDVDEGVKLYVNGKIVAESPVSRATSENKLPLRFGRSAKGGASYWPGLLDNISIWHRALSDREIIRLNNGRVHGGEKGLSGYWPFDEGEGNIAHDISVHKNHGKIHGSPSFVPIDAKEMLIHDCL